jgi:hypothetical protein
MLPRNPNAARERGTDGGEVTLFAGYTDPRIGDA